MRYLKSISEFKYLSIKENATYTHPLAGDVKIIEDDEELDKEDLTEIDDNNREGDE